MFEPRIIAKLDKLTLGGAEKIAHEFIHVHETLVALLHRLNDEREEGLHTSQTRLALVRTSLKHTAHDMRQLAEEAGIWLMPDDELMGGD